MTDVTTTRLRLVPPTMHDLDPLHTIYSDPRVWTHLPSARHAHVDETRSMLESWMAAWRNDGLGPWLVRPHGGGPLLGHGGCSLRRGCFWNLGYRFAPEAHGHGYATEVAEAAVTAARAHRSDLPVIAYLLEHNVASRRVAEKVGLSLRQRGPDTGNPDTNAVRLVFADRELSDEVREAVMR